MKPILIVITAFVCFSLGWLLAHHSEQLTDPLTASLEISRAQKAKILLEDGAKAIDAAQTPQERQARIEELLQNVCKLFMIDLSLRLQPTAAGASADTAQTSAAPSPLPAAPEPPPKSLETAKIGGGGERSKLEVTILTADAVHAETALKDLARTDFSEGFQGARALPPQIANTLLGNWHGTVRMYDIDKPRWAVQISLETSPRSSADHEYYQYRISLDKDPNDTKSKSVSSGEGDLKDFSQGEGDHAPVYIEAGDDVLELFRRSPDLFIGLVFSPTEGRRGKREAIGSLRLERD